MTRIVVHIQNFINKRNVKYEPYGPWVHVPEQLWKKPKCSETLSERFAALISIPNIISMNVFSDCEESDSATEDKSSEGSQIDYSPPE